MKQSLLSSRRAFYGAIFLVLFLVTGTSLNGLASVVPKHVLKTANYAISTPLNLTYTNSGATFTVRWDVVAGATGYKVDLSKTSDFSSYITGFQDKAVIGNTFLVTAVTPNTIYYVRVRSTTGTETSVSAEGANLTVPGFPPGISVNTQTTTSFVLGWSAVVGASSYSVDISTVSSFATYLPGYKDVRVTSGNSLPINGLSPGTVYYFRIAGINGSGIGSYTTSSVATLFIAPSNLSYLNSTADFTVNWDAVPGATGYLIDVSTSPTFSTFLSGYQIRR